MPFTEMGRTLGECQGLISETTGHLCGDVREAGTGEANMGIISILKVLKASSRFKITKEGSVAGE